MRKLASGCIDNGGYINCEIPGPIKVGEKSGEIELEFDVTKLESGMEQLKWENIEVYASGEELSPFDNAGNKYMIVHEMGDLSTVTSYL